MRVLPESATTVTQLSNILDNRELALGIWVALFVLWATGNPNVRDALKALVKTATAKAIVLIAFALCCYTYLVALLLSAVGIWNASQLKPTLIWLVASGMATLFTANKIQEEERYFSRAVKSNFKLAVLIDFVVNLHVFPFLVEFLLVPFGVFIGAVVAYSEHKPKYASAQKLANGILAAVGLIAVAYSVWQISSNLSEFATIENLRNFATPILLSILFVPFVFFLAVYMAYEEVFTRLQFVITDRSLHPCAKLALLRYARFNLKALRGWLRGAWQENFKSCVEIRESVRRVVTDERPV